MKRPLYAHALRTYENDEERWTAQLFYFNGPDSDKPMWRCDHLHEIKDQALLCATKEKSRRLHPSHTPDTSDV